MTELRTERLVLRQWRDEDRAPFAALNADPIVMEHFPSTMTREASDAFVDFNIADDRRARVGALGRRGGHGEFIGFVGLERAAVQAHSAVSRSAGGSRARRWGHGYATEAARAVLAFAFDELGLDEVISFTTAENVRSQRVMERIGMTRDPADDFDHPNVDGRARSGAHVLYRLARG